FLCPSEAITPPSDGPEGAASNYQPNFGTSWSITNRTDGPFHVISSFRLAAITDGTSQTAAFSEHAFGPGGPGGRSVDRLRGGYDRGVNASRSQAELEQWCSLPNPPGATILAGSPIPWSQNQVGYRHVFTPNHFFCVEVSEPA